MRRINLFYFKLLTPEERRRRSSKGGSRWNCGRGGGEDDEDSVRRGQGGEGGRRDEGEGVKWRPKKVCEPGKEMRLSLCDCKAQYVQMSQICLRLPKKYDLRVTLIE